jgi:hypothetical protein
MTRQELEERMDELARKYVAPSIILQIGFHGKALLSFSVVTRITCPCIVLPKKTSSPFLSFQTNINDSPVVRSKSEQT